MATVINKLYRVTLQGMTTNSTGVAEGISYVVAADSNIAYNKVRNRLDKKDYGFKKDRELDKVELMASDYDFNDIGTMLILWIWLNYDPKQIIRITKWLLM